MKLPGAYFVDSFVTVHPTRSKTLLGAGAGRGSTLIMYMAKFTGTI